MKKKVKFSLKKISTTSRLIVYPFYGFATASIKNDKNYTYDAQASELNIP